MTGELAPKDFYDLIMVIVRKSQIAEVLPALARNSSPNVLFISNSASGSREIEERLGRHRVMLGFAAGGGRRGGQIVRYIRTSETQPTTIGELSGEVAPRLWEVEALLGQAGFPVLFERHMD